MANEFVGVATASDLLLEEVDRYTAFAQKSANSVSVVSILYERRGLKVELHYYQGIL